MEADVEPGEPHYFKGELYRLRGAQGDDRLAIESYHAALATGAAPPETYISLGLLHRRSGDRAAAKEAFLRYLEAKPDAEDRAMVESYVLALE
jgi:predicted TPR repeat methyltransferase